MSAAPGHPEDPGAALVRGLGLAAATALVVGDLIGTGVFLKARVMTCNVGTPMMVIAVWVAAGLLSLTGAFTYAELSTMMPRAGGEYVFIREAYGPLWAFLYGWTRFFVANTGGLAGLAAGFAIFLNVLTGGALSGGHLAIAGLTLPVGPVPLIAVAAIAVVTLVNSAAVSVGGRVATIFSAFKIVLVLAVGLAACLLARGDWGHLALSAAAEPCAGVDAAARGGFAGFGAAMLGALWAYNGWNELSYVAGEVEEPRRNLPLAIVGGIVLVGALYVFVNAAYFYVLAPAEVAAVPPTSAVATAAVARVLGERAAAGMAGVMAVSIFGSLQVSSLVTARVPFAMARDGVFFAPLGRVSARTRVPVAALLAQAGWAIVLVLSGSFDALTDYSMFAIVIFVALSTASVFVFRLRLPDAERPYRTWGYPVVPALFLLVAGWLVVNTVLARPWQALAGLGLMALGLPYYAYAVRRGGCAARAA